MEGGRRFKSKLLLFGEYGIMLGSKALCVPFPDYSGYLAMSKDPEDVYVSYSNRNLRELLDYLQADRELASIFDIDAAEQDLNKGLYFHSSIPEGYGIGSSGALCAAFYDKYGVAKEVDQADLKQLLGQMEAFFHGKSSGIDPLVSYLDIPFLVSSKDIIGLSISIFKKYNGRLFFVDTGLKRRSNNLISGILRNIQSDDSLLIKQQLIDITNRCVDSVVQGADVSDAFALLSSFQLQHMNTLIPNQLQGLWEKGLKTNEFSLKLCGAGGGGFLVGITSNPDVVRRIFKDDGFGTAFVNL